MSAFMDGRGPHGDGANHVEPTRTGPIESVARGKAETSFAGSSSRAAEGNRPPGAADADATSRVWGRFTEHDTTEENLRTLQGWLRRYGRPLAHYTDKNSFQKAGPQPRPEQLRGDPLRTQFGRALHELGIEWIAAHSPQAKGRIERLFATLQDRLVKEMRLAGIDNIAAANQVLEMRFLPAWEERFTVTPRKARNAHRRLGGEQHPKTGHFYFALTRVTRATRHEQLSPAITVLLLARIAFWPVTTSRFDLGRAHRSSIMFCLTTVEGDATDAWSIR
jgi:hypothetical protein